MSLGILYVAIMVLLFVRNEIVYSAHSKARKECTYTHHKFAEWLRSQDLSNSNLCLILEKTSVFSNQYDLMPGYSAAIFLISNWSYKSLTKDITGRLDKAYKELQNETLTLADNN